MRADLIQFRQPLCKAFGYDFRFKRAKSDALDSRNSMDLFNQVQQAIPGIGSVGAQMNAGQNDLLVALLCQCRNLGQHMVKLPAPYPASCIRNNTVAAELVTAILHLDKSARMLRCSGQGKFLVFLLRRIDIDDSGALFFLKIIFQKCDKFILLVIANDQIHRCILPDFIRICLDITACRNNNRIRI